MSQRKRPGMSPLENLYGRIAIAVDQAIGWDKLPTPIAGLPLAAPTRIPTLTVGKANDGVSMMPLLELPIMISTCRRRLQYVSAGRFTKICVSGRSARNR